MDTRDTGGPSITEMEKEKRLEEFKKFFDGLSGKIHDLIKSNPLEEGDGGHTYQFQRQAQESQIQDLIRHEILEHPPYFYTSDGRPSDLVPGSYEKIEDKDLAFDIARLGEISGHDTTVVEWNKKDYQKFNLSTFIPDATDKKFRNQQVYANISFEIAKFLVEEKGIRTELGRMGNEEWWNEETGKYESEPAENFTTPRLKENLKLDYTEPRPTIKTEWRQ
jgi:hypothetical protein